MKKQLTVALGLAVLATPAFATKARLQGLGEDTYGSFYVNDNRNVWLNPAQVNNHKDLVTFEYGDTNSTIDQNQSPRAEGGLYKAVGNLVWGIHMGSASNSANQLRAGAGLVDASLDATTGAISFKGTANEGNNIDLFVGGDAGLKWGANLGYNKANDQSAGSRGEGLRSRLGVIMGDTQVYANVNLINNARGAFDINAPLSAALGGPATAQSGHSTFTGKLGFQVGAIHAYEGNTFTVDYRQFDAENEINVPGLGANGKKEDQSIKQLIAGVGRVTRLNDKTNLFTKATFQWADAKNDGLLGGSFAGPCGLSPYFCEEYKTMRVPVVVGLETEATSWLTIRASVQQSVWGKEEDKRDERTIRNNTIVNAGATLKFGELSVDGLVSTSQAASGTLGENTATGNGTLRLDELMTRVGVNYRF